MFCRKCGKECIPRPKEIMCLCMAKHFMCIPCMTTYQDWGDKITEKIVTDLDKKMYEWRD